VLDDRVREVLARLEREDAEERERGLPPEERSRAVAPATGRFLFSLVAPQTACEVLEVGGSRGYSSIWFAAGVRYLGGRVVSIERDPDAAERWRANVREAGLGDWMELIEGDALDVLHELEDIFDVVFIDAEKSQYEQYFALARERVEPGGLIVADNVISHRDTLEAYSRARQSDVTLLSTTVPLDRGLELTVVLSESL
jgi:caffeoyl-CoA O-methyltransferase